MPVKITEEESSINQDIEIRLFLEGVLEKYGYDFRNYSAAFMKRRLVSRMRKSSCGSISEMQHRMLNDPDFFHAVLLDISLNVTDMFRDPRFFASLRETAVPILKTYPYLKIWHAGCATGEEVYSLAMLLGEEDMLGRTILYATDFNQAVVQKASEGIYPIEKIKTYAENYYKAGGKGSFTDYFTVKYDSAIVNNSLKKNIVFSDHNLVSDGVFGEMNMIVCRNVLIYFNRELQNRVIGLLYDSLLPGGLLCLGTKETLLFSKHKDKFRQLHKLNIYRKAYDSERYKTV
ncbi:MAG TPA: protein-glutamate O-methyltransferase CheR [Bacteroidales bacterium]|jgi:chemotaxis protein methyltransferase CheR|nr:protein-glutamate O-methyltransferase CheR [Bacteroidales bacterium]